MLRGELLGRKRMSCIIEQGGRPDLVVSVGRFRLVVKVFKSNFSFEFFTFSSRTNIKLTSSEKKRQSRAGESAEYRR